VILVNILKNAHNMSNIVRVLLPDLSIQDSRPRRMVITSSETHISGAVPLGLRWTGERSKESNDNSKPKLWEMLPGSYEM
jgi:hypothetical protein